MTTTRYDEKIGRIRSGHYRVGDFMIADAKDADLSGGVLTAGRRRDASGRVTGNRNRPDFLAEMTALIHQDVIDILLASTSNIERLVAAGAFADSRILPAFRANDATDVWGVIRGGSYRDTPSLPFRGTDLGRARADLCLYSITFNNDTRRDLASLEAFRTFRDDAQRAGKRYFLEVFNPNTASCLGDAPVGDYVNDCIVRTLAALTRAERPEFLKVAYNGPKALEELAGFDDEVVVGVLGGGAGTSRDTFELIAQAERFGARIALFGRKINNAEHQPSLIACMRAVADREIGPVEAVRLYHDRLARLGLVADRDLEADLQVTSAELRAEAGAK